jgi:hypothetical protein
MALLLTLESSPTPQKCILYNSVRGLSLGRINLFRIFLCSRHPPQRSGKPVYIIKNYSVIALLFSLILT